MASKKTLKRRMQRLRQMQTKGLKWADIPVPSTNDANAYAVQLMNSFIPKTVAYNLISPSQTIGCSIATKQEKEYDMSESLELRQISYLKERAYDTYSDKRSQLVTQFAIEDDTPPRTPKELVDRIISGKYILPDPNQTQRYYDSEELVYVITWRDPTKTKDVEGFKAAEKLLEADYTATKDIIVVSDAKTGLQAVQDFAKKQYS